MGERNSGYMRPEHDWYVEPAWCAEALKSRVDFCGPVHDPCCGSGTIPLVFGGTGSDICDRGFGYPVRDFLDDLGSYSNIVTNPPYKTAERIIEHALVRARHRVAVLVPTKFLSSQRRYELFTQWPVEKVLIFSRRPSMPPGELLQRHGEAVRGGGSIDFCWIVWNHDHLGPPEVDWIL